MNHLWPTSTFLGRTNAHEDACPHPPPRRVAFRIARSENRLFLRCFLGDVREQAFIHSQLTTRGRVVSTVQQQMALSLFLRSRDSHHDSIEDVHEHLAVMTIGSAQDHRERNAFGIGQQRAFTPSFSSVGGVAARGFRRTSAPLLPRGAFTMLPSAACHSQSIPSSWSYSSSMMAHAARKHSCSTQA